MKLVKTKQVLLLAALCFLGLTSVAQPAFTSQYTPSIGETEMYVTYYDADSAAALLPGTVGANQTWNFSFTDSGGFLNIHTYIDPATTGYADTFPTSNLALAHSNFNGFDTITAGVDFFLATPAEYTTLSTAGGWFYDNPRTMALPLTFGSTVTDSFSATSPLGTSGGIMNLTGHAAFTYDAFGILTLNDSVYNTVRLYTADTMVTDAGSLQYSITTTYTWYNTANQEPVLSIYYAWQNYLGNITTSLEARIYVSQNVSVGCDLVVNLSGTDATCGVANGSIANTFTGGTAPYTFVWNTGNTNQDLIALTAGTYIVTITDTDNCTTTDSITINDTPAPTLSTVVTNATVGQSNGAIDATVAGGLSPYTFVWSNGTTTEDQSSLVAGAYDLTVVDANGCAATTSATVLDDTTSALTLTSTSNDATCGQVDGSIDLTVIGGTSPYTFAWSNAATNEDPNNLLAGIYSVTILDAAGNSATTTATVGTICGTPSFVNSQVTGTTTTINWQSQPCAVKYRLRIKMMGNGGSNPWTTYFINAPDTVKVITGLVPGAVYKYRLRAQCSPGGSVLSPWSASFFLTAGGVDSCVAPTDATATDITSSGANVTWMPVNGAYGYQFRYREVGTTVWTPIVSNNGTVGLAALSGLQENTTYEFQLRTKCSVGPNVFSIYTPVETFATPVLRLAESDLLTLSIYPNPTAGVATVITGAIDNSPISITVLNAVGQKIYSESRIPINGSVSFNLSSFPAGLYMVDVRTHNSRVVRCLVKE